MNTTEVFRPPAVEDGFTELDHRLVSQLSYAVVPHVLTSGGYADYSHTVVGSDILADYYSGVLGAYRNLAQDVADSGHPEPIAVCYGQDEASFGVDIGFVSPGSAVPTRELRVDIGEAYTRRSRLDFELHLNVGSAVVSMHRGRTSTARAKPNNILTVPVDRAAWKRPPESDEFQVSREPSHTAIVFGQDALSVMPEFEHILPAYREARRMMGKMALSVINGANH